jgi:hypothetical protein
MKAGERAMTVAEFGRRISVSPRTAARKVTAGEVEVVNVGSRLRPRLRVTESALATYLESRRVRGSAA